MKNVVLIQSRDSDEVYRVNFADLYSSFQVNYQLNSNYEISFTLTYTKDFKDAFNAAKPKAWVWFNDQWYVVQQTESSINDKGYLTLKITANHILLDKLKNLRIDDQKPTEDNPDIKGGGSSSSTDDQNKSDIVIKKTDEKQYYSLDDRLHKFFDNNNENIKYELHGNFPNAAVDIQNTSLYEWLGSHLKDYSAYYIPDGNTLKVYDMANLQHQTGRQFRYLNNMTTAELKTDDNNIVNDCQVYGGKMEKDITFGSGGGGNLDSAEDFCKSSINADFGVNKQQMISNFAARSQRVHAWGVDVNKLYDTVKNAGVSPEWFFAYELQEQGTGYGWLNHTYKHGDAYQDAVSVCNWIKQTAQSATIKPAWSAPEGSMTPNSQLAAKWNQEFSKGTIGRVYLQGTAAATWDLAGVTPNPAIGKPISGCVSVIRSWGGHTNSGSTGGGWGWPFPSVGEGTFTKEQSFGSGSGWIRPGSNSDFHDGLDFGSVDHPGSEIHAVHGGKCTISRAWGGGAGYYCVIQDSTGLNVEYQEAFSSPSDIYVNVGDEVQLGQVIGRRTTNHLHLGITRHSFPEAFNHWSSDDGTWLDPQSIIKNGQAPDGSSSGSTTTTEQTYYSLHYHYENQDSINRYGRHKGKNVVMDSIYDMDELKKCVDATVQHDPPTTLTIKDIFEINFAVGDIWRVIVPEMTVNYDVTLMGIKYNPFNPDNKDATLSFNNTGLTMQNVIHSIYNDIHQMNTNVNRLDTFATIGGRQENHFGNLDNNSDHKFSKNQADVIDKFVNS
ncbi:phage tail protein [Limosilactobacillus fastidiosus]|uniref:Phage tail protein n=1 Tax=Limosilactobacillus fastidiosus TaxID=2759855 RepID=A0A7W3TZX7_9LACO|nr:phage tail protein [Limosilactobacillus fastidiosus]MBB1086367.1 phage tail protein [Limosilactobacillus fastidiosus]MCD7086258.1 phage tail protein [Limosilactobacillus fastidiosus]MCD7115021.1 phage tail protein [Limosilactobacillus fastidiosus]MCD7116816.1 phage tail protein [Limosilactobacillus fastidiosus]